MQHEREYDKRSATPNIRTLDDMARDAANMDRFPNIPIDFNQMSEAGREQVARDFAAAADTTELRRLLQQATKREDLDAPLGPPKVMPKPAVIGTFYTSPLGLNLRCALNTARRWVGLKPKHNFKI